MTDATPTAPFRVEVDNSRSAEASRDHVHVGQKFVFVEPGKRPQGRLAKLLKRTSPDSKKAKVVPLVDTVELDGFRIIPTSSTTEPLHALVTDRDLYRAEEDTVHFFLAMPDVPAGLSLVVEVAGDVFTEVSLEKASLPTLRDHGVHVEQLSMLLPGDYSAQLAVDGRRIGQAVSFTVASYTLAPLTGRLTEHSLDDSGDKLSFALEVESYEQPFDQPLRVELVCGDDVVDEVVVEASAPGLYFGEVTMGGDDALRLRLVGVEDAERTCDVVIPGSRKHERQQTLVGNLGVEQFLALMPTPASLPLRGSFLSSGDVHTSPIVVDEVITQQGELRLQGEVDELTLVVVDVDTGKARTQACGRKAAGDVVSVEVTSSACAVYVGGFVNGKPWEGFTQLFKPNELQLGLDVTHVEDDKLLQVKVTSSEQRKHPLLLCVRDERLTAQDTPEVSLSASMKRAIDAEQALWLDRLVPLSLDDNWMWTQAGALPVDLDTIDIDEGLLGRMDPWTADAFSVFPLRVVGDAVEVATAQQLQEAQRSHLCQVLGCSTLRLRWASGTDVHEAIADHAQHFQNGMYFNQTPPGILPVQRSRGIGSMFGGSSTGGYAMDLEADLMEAPEMEAGSPPPVMRSAAPMPPPAAAPAGLFEAKADVVDAMSPAPAKKSKSKRRQQTAAKEELLEGALNESVDKGMLPSSSAAPMSPLKPLPPAEPAPATSAESARETFPEVLFFGLVDVEGDTVVDVPLADALGTFTVEVFALGDGDWARTQETVTAEQAVRVELDVPPAVHPGDEVVCSLFASCASRRARVRLLCDGDLVELRTDDGVSVSADVDVELPMTLRFSAQPGLWRAEVVDGHDDTKRDAVEVFIGAPGELRTLAKEVGFLQAGDRITLEEAGDDVLALRVLPGLKETTDGLLTATAGYAHLCCEQTAAKIISAVGMYLSAGNDMKALKKAESIITAGVRRERKMYVEGKGFRMYPGRGSVDTYWGPLTVPYLWRLAQLDGLDGVSPALQAAVDDGLAMADNAGRAYKLSKTPSRITSAEEAYRVVLYDAGRGAEAATWVGGSVTVVDGKPQLNDPRGAAHNRASLSYAAAVLLRAGDLRLGVQLADVVLRQLNGDGCLYSTFDSVAASAMLAELQRAKVGQDGVVVVNGKKMTTAEAAALGDSVESLEVKDGVCAVQLDAIRTERWSDFQMDFGVTVGFRNATGGKTSAFKQGDRAKLVVELQDGYQVGDLVHVSLPAALSWMKGGGRVQQFSVDFEGETKVEIPVLVTGKLVDKQHFAVCVRNMFEEERASNPGLLAVSAA